MRIIYMGTPDFAVYPLEALLESGKQIVAVVTTPDKPTGRGQRMHSSSVKEFALRHGLPILQPENLKSPDFVASLRELKADLQIVVAFRMLPEIVWNMPPLGTINLHASLLPQYRGAAPINWAIINGETRSGVSVFRLRHEIDTGDILAQEPIDIMPDDNAGTLHDKMAHTGAKLIVSSVEAIQRGDYEAIPQPTDQNFRAAPKIFRETCRLDFEKNVVSLHNLVRGLSPYPTAWFEYNGQTFKVFESSYEVVNHDNNTGEIISDNKTFVKIAAADGFLSINKIQLQGKKTMNIRDFLLGYKF